MKKIDNNNYSINSYILRFKAKDGNFLLILDNDTKQPILMANEDTKEIVFNNLEK